MCGRYTQHHSTDQVVMRFDVDSVVTGADARYNAAPTQMLPVITRDKSGTTLRSFRWGLIPFWAKEQSIGARMINARSDTLAEKPAFRTPLRKRRCLVPADGFYEWKSVGKAKQPIYYKLKSDDLFAFAGLWEEWRGPDGVPVNSFTIITTEPNALAALAHDRMPAMLLEEDEAAWLDPTTTEASDLLPLLHPYPAELMEAYAVGKLVGSPRNDDAGLIVPDSAAAL